MLRLYISKSLDHVRESTLTQLLTNKTEFVGNLFQKIPTKPFQSSVELVADPLQADYLLLRHYFFDIEHEREYLGELEALSESTGKRIIVFAYGDRHDPVHLKNAVVLRTASYRNRVAENEIIIPPFVEDVGVEFGHDLRQKSDDLATVGFAGWVYYDSILREIKYRLRTVVTRMRVSFGLRSPAEYQGLFFRRRLIKLLQSTDKLKTLFHLRSAYSGAKRTIEGDPDTIRHEFISSIKDSDFALAVRGDGNYSLRFFEIVSLGRIPLFIDTDCVLPLEDEIDYDAVMLRVPYTEIDRLDQIVADFWAKLSPEEFGERQRKARELFETKLRADVFYTDLFSRLEKEARNN
jgi:hypothetical protein